MGPRVGSLGVWARRKEWGERDREEVMVVILGEMTEEKRQREFACFESEPMAD